MFLTKNINLIIAKFIVFAFILLFPFGQLLRLEFTFAGKVIPLLAVDIIAGFSIFFLPFLRKPKTARYFYYFFSALIFSLILSVNYFKLEQIVVGSLYLFRIFGYFAFYVLVWNLSVKDRENKNNILILLLISISFGAVFAWLQYFIFPDLTYLKFIGWDDHLGRLVGTYLDPAFTGMIFVAGFLAAFMKYIRGKRGIYLILSVFFLLSLLFTYSRASYLALLTGLILILFLKKKIKPVIFTILAVFILLLPFLPRGEGEGVRLERTRSITFRLNNYRETIQIIRKAPLFGIGYNNLCWVRTEMFSDSVASHSCSGSDSSILLVMATSGIVGLLVFINISILIYRNISDDYYGDLAKAFLFALFFHSMFSNSLFYPWLMGIASILLAISTEKS